MYTSKQPIRVTLLLIFLLAAIPAAHAKVVNVWGDTSRVAVVNSFYDGLPAHSSSVIGGDLDSNNLSGVDLLWVVQPQSLLTGAENTHLANFLAVGGRIAYMGEHCSFPGGNENINPSLTAVGSNIQIACGTTQDGGFHTATRVGGQILDHPLTTGVNSYRYAAFAPLAMGGLSETLMLGTDLTSVMMGFENIGPGSVFLITDQNPFDDPFAEDNEIMFENLLVGDTTAPPVRPPPPSIPVPTLGAWALILMAFVLAVFGAIRMRRRSS